MNARQNAQIKMFDAVRTACNAHVDKWTAFAPFADSFAEFVALREEIRLHLRNQIRRLAGETAEKKDRKARLAGELYRIVEILQLYSKLHNQPKVASDVKISHSNLRTMGTHALIGFGTKILQVAGGIDPLLLAPLGFSNALLISAQDRLGEFTTAADIPLNRLSERTAATRALAEKVNATLELLRTQLDRGAYLLSDDHPNFYKEYKVCREIIDPGFRKRAVIVKITDSVTGLKIPGVEALINPGGIAKVSAAGGRFYIDRMPDGRFTMTLKHPLYKEKELPFFVVKNERKVMEVVMEGK